MPQWYSLSLTHCRRWICTQAVIDKVRQRVSPEDFMQFKQQSALFMRGEAGAPAFHTQVVALGLAPLLPDLAALCPDPTKRSDLLEAHRAAFINNGATKVCHAPLTFVHSAQLISMCTCVASLGPREATLGPCAACTLGPTV